MSTGGSPTPKLIAPTEPAALKVLGRVSSFPERLGADIAWTVEGRWVGIQRKTWADLWASVQDGRLQKELGQLQQCAYRGLIVEGVMAWTAAGESRDPYLRMSRSQWEGIEASVQWRYGGLVVRTVDVEETGRRVSQLAQWLGKGSKGLARRPPSPQAWGSRSNREWGVYVLQSFPGIGPTLAEAVYAKWGVPLAWTVTQEELAAVEGLGALRVRRLWDALDNHHALDNHKRGNHDDYDL